MKNFVKLFLILFIVFYAENSVVLAQSSSSGGNGITQTLFNSDNPLQNNMLTDMGQDLANSASPQNITDYINGAPVYSTVFPQSMAAFLCDIRRLFCGKLTVTIVAVSVFICGILLLNGRMTWTWAIIVTVAGITLTQAEYATDYILGYSLHLPGNIFNLDLSIMNQVCMCFPTLPGLNPPPCNIVINGVLSSC